MISDKNIILGIFLLFLSVPIAMFVTVIAKILKYKPKPKLTLLNGGLKEDQLSKNWWREY